MFGKSFTDYIRFQRVILILIAAVWALRLGLSLAGVSVSGAQFVSVTGVLILGSLYYGWAAGRKGFGSFKELYILNVIQGVFSQILVALAIILAIFTGQDNLYTIPEFYPPAQGIDVLGLPLPPDGKNFGHAAEHVFIAGLIAFPIMGWLLSSIIFLLTRKRTRQVTASNA